MHSAEPVAKEYIYISKWTHCSFTYVFHRCSPLHLLLSINCKTVFTQRKQPLPTNFCGIVLLRLATLLASLSSTKALSDPVWLKSSLCSFWLLSSFTTGKQDRKVDFRVKVIWVWLVWHTELLPDCIFLTEHRADYSDTREALGL